MVYDRCILLKSSSLCVYIYILNNIFLDQVAG